MLSPRTLSFLRRCTLAGLAVYWIALFVGTHIPMDHSPDLHGSDKWIHFFAYAGLAGLATLAVGGRSALGLQTWHFVAIVSGLALFGGLDELTQPLVSRQADWFDWFADVGGVIAGAALGALALRVLKIGREQPAAESEIDRSPPSTLHTGDEFDTPVAAVTPAPQPQSAAAAQ